MGRVKKLLTAVLAMTAVVIACLGTATAAYAEGPIAKIGSQKVIKAVSGDRHSAAITADGSLWMWGANDVYQLGDGTNVDRSTSTPVKVLDNIVDVSLGANHSAAIDADGVLWCWGRNYYGESGIESGSYVKTPSRVMDHVKSVSLGSSHSAAIKDDGTLWMWGQNWAGELGVSYDTVSFRRQPAKVMGDVASVALGPNISAVIKEDASLWTWGYWGSRILGDNSTNSRSTPTKILEGIVSVDFGLNHAAALTTDGQLLTWGWNRQGELGEGETKHAREEPRVVMDGIVAFSMGGSFSAAIDEGGTLWMWGLNLVGQLGNGTTEGGFERVRVMEDVASVSLGSNYSAAIKSDGSLWSWGANDVGQLGDGTTENHHEPVRISIGNSPQPDPPIRTEFDAWSFANSSDDWNPDGYYINEEDYRRFCSDLPDTEREKFEYASREAFAKAYSRFDRFHTDLPYYVSPFNVDGDSMFYKPWGGSCYGMSLWTCLADADILSPMDIEGGNFTLYDTSMSYSIQSAINYYHHQQYLLMWQSIVSDFMVRDNSAQLDEVERLAKASGAGETPIMLLFYFYTRDSFDSDGQLRRDASEAGHAVVGYALESGDFTEEVYSYLGADAKYVDGTEYSHRVVIYDCAYPTGGNQYNLYFNDSGSWCIPGYRAISTSSYYGKRTLGNNAYLALAMPGDEALNFIDYNTGGALEGIQEEEGAFLGYDAASSFELRWDSHVAHVSGTQVVDGAMGQITIQAPVGVTSGGSTLQGAATAGLPESSSYTVESASSPIFYQLSSDGYFTVAAADSTGSVTFGADGAAKVAANDSAPYYLAVTADEGKTSLPWQTVEVIGEKAKDIEIDLQSNGVLISGDVDGAEIYGTDGVETESIKLSTDGDEVLIAGNEDGELAAFIDTDENGSYETEIGESIALKASNVADVPDQAWTGTSIKPKPAVTFEGKTLAEGTDFAYSWEDNVDPGVAKVIVTGKGAYKGTVVVEFKIVKSDSGERPDGSDCPSKAFPDIDISQWYHAAVDWALEAGAMNGYEDGTFGPFDPLTREQAATVLWNMLGEGDLAAPAAPHTDVTQDEWYSPYVNWAVENGYMNGYEGANRFGVGDALTREQFACVLANAAGADLESADPSAMGKLPDADEVSAWAEAAMAWAVDLGVVNGVETEGGRELQPGRTISRAEMAAMMMNAVQKSALKIK